jgi:Tfp pilus assembly PilM family ATPase
MKTVRYLGISFLHGRMQFAEIEHSRKVVVTQLAESEMRSDFLHSGNTLNTDPSAAADLAGEIRNIIRRYKITAEHVSFAIPPSSVFINILPVDTSLDDAELKHYLRWEREQYFPGTDSKDYVIDTHRLPKMNDSAQQAFMVAVHRPLALFLQRVCREMKLKLNIIDIDHFSTEKTLLINYPEILKYDIALVGVRENSIDASLIHDGEMTDYRAFQKNDDSDPVKIIGEYLRYLKQREDSVPAALLLHGTEVTKNLVLTLRKETGIGQTLALNAFRKLKAEEKLIGPYGKKNTPFAAAVGLALRTA